MDSLYKKLDSLELFFRARDYKTKLIKNTLEMNKNDIKIKIYFDVEIFKIEVHFKKIVFFCSNLDCEDLYQSTIQIENNKIPTFFQDFYIK